MQSPAISELVASLGTNSLAELPRTLATLSTRWPYPRGDLYNWINPLNRFDEILQDFNTRYGLNLGPQNKPFGLTQLLDGSPDTDEKSLRELGFGPEGDRELIESILNFSRLLLEKCGNRVIFNGGDRLNDLLNTTSLSLLQSTLRLTLSLAQRYRERIRNYPQPFSTADSIFRLELDKLHKICSPISQDLHPTPKPGSTSPTKTTKSKDKASQPARIRRGSTVVNPNDFRSLCRESQVKTGSKAAVGSHGSEGDWQQWASIKLIFPSMQNPQGPQHPTDPSNGSNQPDSPTPIRRQSTTSGLRLSRLSTSEEPGTTAVSGDPAEESKPGDLGKLEISSTELMKTSIDKVLEKRIGDTPQAFRYELLHKLRVAYGLITSSDARRHILAIRLLAYASLAYILPEAALSLKLFGQDQDSIKRQQLIQQLVNLLHDGEKGRSQIPLEIQTLSLETLSALLKQKLASSEIISALGVNADHGLLLLLTQRAVKDLNKDEDLTDNQEGDEWRDMVFSMLKNCLEATAHYSRPSDIFATAGIISCYATALEKHTLKALRVQSRVVDFLKTFSHHVKDGLAVLTNNKAFGALCDLLGYVTEIALKLEKDGFGIPSAYKTPTTDYEIPYVHQQVIRTVLDLLNDVSGHQGTHADRVVRSLIDSPTLLGALRLIVDNGRLFGPHTWSEAVKCICGFLHYEPTSYAIMAEAGVIRSMLCAITLNDPIEQAASRPNEQVGTTTVHSFEVDTDVTEASPPAVAQAPIPKIITLISSVPEQLPQGILPTRDTIATVAQSFSAICLTAGGSETFMSSRALQKFFEIFESPEHVKALKAGNLLNVLGSNFDELVRHHPNLRPAVVSATIVMITRVKYICQSKAWDYGQGPKMYVDDGNGLRVSGGYQSLLVEISPQPRTNASGQVLSPVPLTLPDGNVLTCPPNVDHSSRMENMHLQDLDSEGLNALDYMTPALGFLAALFENQSICTSFMEGGGTDLILDLATIPSMPDDLIFGPDGTSNELASITHMMAETKPHLVLPSLLQRALYACKEAQHFAQSQPRDMACYFDPLIRQNSSVTDEMDLDNNEEDYVTQNATRIVKSLVALYHLIQLVSEVFEAPIYGSRSSHGQPFGQVNLADVYSELCDALGQLAAACIRESIAIQRHIPENWLAATRPKWFFGSNEDINSILGLRNSRQANEATPTDTGAVNGETESGTSIVGGLPRSISMDIGEAEHTAPFKNVHFLRHLLVELPSTITTFFRSLGRGLTAKRRVDSYQRQNVYKVAESIAAALRIQLCPSFFEESGTMSDHLDPLNGHFAYLAVALHELNLSLFDQGTSPDQGPQCNTAVLSAFKATGGLTVLNRIGTDFFNQLKRCELAQETIQQTTAANSGLKTCLQILDSLTSSKCVVDSTQSATLKNPDPDRPFYFMPAQLLLELRLDAMPLTRLIWDSNYADQASIAVVERLISILKNILNGDQEHDAHRRPDSHPHIQHHPAKKLPIDNQKVAALKSHGFEEDLAREALFRTHGNSTFAEEYCKALANNPTRQRCPVPETELEITRSPRGGDTAPVDLIPTMQAGDDQLVRDHVDETVAGLLSAIAAGEAEGTNSPIWPSSAAGAEHDEGSGEDTNDRPTAFATMNINNILNAGDAPDSHSTLRDTAIPASVSIQQEIACVDVMNSKRESIREELPERCNNLLSNHHGIVFDLAELILSGAKKLSEDAAKTYRGNATEILIQALLSLQEDGIITESAGKKIAASARLTALLLQDKPMFESAESLLRDAFESLLLFVRTAPSDGPSKEDSFPWIGPVLLIIEKMLSRDAEPDKIEWRTPSDLEVTGPAQFTPTAVFKPDQKAQLFRAVVDILPHIGKDKSLALSISRVLVVLTRDRDLACLLAQKRNIQRLFVMVKQLVTGTDDRLQSALMIILRHIIEDDDTLRQIMKSEIIASFGNRSSSRQVDTAAFVRELYHLALRSPTIFVEAANDTVKLQRYESRERAQILVLKSTETDAQTEHKSLPADASTSSTERVQTGAKPADSIETQDDDNENSDKGKAAESRAPVVEHPDGVIHFLLSELLSYKDVEDKAPTGITGMVEEKLTPAPAPVENSSAEVSASPLSVEPAQSSAINTKPEKTTWKAEENPIYVYRCFLLQCLTELLLSYNRTKTEFINFSRKADPLASTPSKPRSGVLNYLLTALVPGSIEMEDSVACKKKTSISALAMKVIVALCSKTFEIPISSSATSSEDHDDEPNLTFVRRFVLEHAIKAFKDASSSSESPENRYSRLLGLADLFHRLLTKPNPTDGSLQASVQHSSFRILSRMMFEKNLISVLTSSLADIDLTFPGSKRVIKYILKPLNELTMTASRLSLTSSTPISSALGSAEEDISSASSVSDMQDTREETPDLFRNSALGIMEPSRQDESSSQSNDDEDEDMYEEEEYVDEMDYGDGGGDDGPDDGEVVSDEEIDEELHGPSHMEGLSGDVPMDIELVMNGGHGMDVDTEDDEDEEEDEEDEEDDEDEDDETEDDDDGDDFEIEGDDVDMGGEINADDENDSLNEAADAEEDWEDEGDGEEEIEFHDGHGVMPEFGDVERGDDPARAISVPQEALNNLLQAYNENPDNTTGNMVSQLDALLGQGGDDDPPDDDEDVDDDDEEDDLDENDGMAFETFNDMLDVDDIIDQHDQWPWGEPSLPRRHRHVRASGHLPSFLTRHLRPGAEIAQLLSGPHRRHAVPARPGGDDGTNPLLQRPSNANDSIRITSMSHMPPQTGLEPPSFGASFTRAIIGDNGETTLNVHGEMLDAVMQALQRGGEIDLLQPGRFQISIDAPGPDIPRILRAGISTSRSLRDETFRMISRDGQLRAVSFEARMTSMRWQEEVRLLYGNGYLEIALRVQKALLSILIPPAQEEEKVRRKKSEEKRKELEEIERKKAEEERIRKEEEEREAAAKAEAEREAAAAAAAAEAEARAAEATRRAEASEGGQQGESEPMEGVQATDTASHPEAAADTTAPPTAEGGSRPTPRVFTTIRGRQLDITNMAIDAEYLEALPEELREEVIMQQYAQQREQAHEEGGDANAIDPDFLDALPEDIREEIRQQEAHARRRRDRDAARRQVASISGPAQAEEMDNDNFLATLDPALRRAILAEQPPEILQQLDPRHAAEGRAHARHIFGFRGIPVGRDTRDELNMREPVSKDNKRQVVQMIDHSGVATLLRLMFLPHQGSLRQNLFTVLRNVCGHRQTRVEVISLLLIILKEGSTDVTAVERSLANLSLRAKATSSQKTPQPLKRTLSMQPTAGISEEMTPVMVIQQCLAALSSLSRHDAHVKTIFLREVDVSASTKSKSKKGKGKENKTTKYPLNDLISLLDRKLIMENSTCLQSFSELLAAVTSPLVLLMRKEKMSETKTDHNKDGDGVEEISAEAPAAAVAEDEAMTEAPPQATAHAPEQTLPAVDVSRNQAGEEKPESSAQAENVDDESKSKKPFDPPIIPDHNLRLVVGILVAQECGRETFNMTLEAILNLSYIPGTSTIFSAELTSQAKALSQVILGDLDELLPLIRESQSGTDLQGIASSKFTPTSSDQSKLLRILMALDYISAPKRPENHDGDGNDESASKSVLGASYESLSLGPLWSKLSECLTTIRQKENIFSFATILLPLIESLMVVCKNTSLKDAPLARQVREQSVTSPGPEALSELEELFFTFTTEHRKILNEIVRQNPKLMSGSGSFALLVKNPKVLEFDNKRSYFTKQIHSRQRELHRPQPPLQLSVRRENVFMDSFKSLYFKSPEEMKYGKLNIRFHGEEGVDAGGVTREWFHVLARGMFNPNYALWEPVASDKTTFHPSRLSGVNNEHLMFFKFIGRIIGKAVHEGRVLDCHFSRAVYKKMLGKEPSLKDLESNDQGEKDRL
jgi:E3 ubiquitin-protein ligase HUWE1